MLTKAPAAAMQYAPPPPGQRPDDISGHTHRQVIGYLGLALPILLVQVQRLRPNAPSDRWVGDSISAYYWTGAVSLFVGLLAALSLFLLTYRGYANESYKYDRGAAIIAGIAAALVALFPTSPPSGLAPLPWWGSWVNTIHTIAAIVLFSMFAVFSLWLFRKTAPGEQPPAEKNRRNAIYLACGIAIVASMIWSVLWGRMGRSIFWPESSALVFFAWSWLVKGRALHSIKASVGAAKDRVAT
jgi:heme/copper-type cytochrome/quinol oxidase subunit 2